MFPVDCLKAGSLRDHSSLRVTIREDMFEISALEFKSKKFIHWRLQLNFFYHILPLASGWESVSQGAVELDFAKGIKIVWRNIHHQATKILPNQYLWWEVMHRHKDEFDGDFEQGIFLKADQRIEEEEDKRNDSRDSKAEDKRRAKDLAKALAHTVSKIRARTRVAYCHQLLYDNTKPLMREDVFEWGDFFMIAQD